MMSVTATIEARWRLRCRQQFTIVGDNNHKRQPDIITFVHGTPLGLIELKVPGQERATLKGAFDQLRTYAAQIWRF
jgi:type I restriction enzyme R subunit